MPISDSLTHFVHDATLSRMWLCRGNENRVRTRLHGVFVFTRIRLTDFKSTLCTVTHISSGFSAPIPTQTTFQVV